MSESPCAAGLRRSNCRRAAARVAAAAALALCLLALAPTTTTPAGAQTSNGADIVISQIYTRGGEPGATYQNDYVELFNRGSQPVNIGDWALHIAQPGPVPTSIYVRFPTSNRVVNPGRYVLIRLAGGPNGAPLPQHDLNLDFSFIPFRIELTPSGTVGLLTDTGDFKGCPSLGTTGVVDYVGYGPGSTCHEGLDGAAPEPTHTQALLRGAGGCEDDNSNKLDFQLGAAAPRNGSTPAAPCGAFDPPSLFDFAVPAFHVSESAGRAEIFVSRSGDLSLPASVEYTTTQTGGTTSDRSDYTTAAGRLRFAPGESLKSFDVLLTDDATQEPNETVELRLSKPRGAGAAVGLRGQGSLFIHDNDFGPAASNPVDNSLFFVRQHYHDFLNREPDAPGLQFWTQGIESCGADATCREVKRVDTSAAFFLSIEFQRTGFLVYKLYRAALPERDDRPRALPRYLEFVRDTQEVGRGVVVGEQTGWEQRLAENTALFLEDFMSRAEFALAYPESLTPAEYVDRLNAQAGGVLPAAERDALVAGLENQTETRATVLLKLAENAEFTRRETNRGFVFMQYVGYLRRAPNNAPDADFSGLDHWLSKLEEFGGDYRRAEMVKAFLSSDEYRARFLAPAP